MTAAQVSRSWPTVGSSASTSAGPCAMADATARRRCSPPERWRGSVPARRASPSVASSSSARACASAPSWPRARAVVSTSSRTVRPTTAVAARCGTQATTRARSTDDHSCGARLRRQAAPAPCVGPVVAAGVRGSGDVDAPRGRCEQTSDGSHQRRLARAARPGEGGELPGHDLEVGVGDRGRACARSSRGVCCVARPRDPCRSRRPDRASTTAGCAAPGAGVRATCNGCGSGAPGTQIPCCTSESA